MSRPLPGGEAARWVLCLVLGAACLALGRSAAAQPAAAPVPGATARDRARTLANQAFALFEAQKFEDALRLFLEAEDVFHAPTLVLHIARARERLSKPARARKDYQRLATETLAPDAPPEFAAAQREARAALERLERELGALDLDLSGPRAAERVVVSIDGERVAEGELAAPIYLDPGQHDVVVRAEGVAPLERRLALGAGEHTRLAYQVPPVPGHDAPLPPTEAPGRALFVPGIATLAVGAVGLGLGIGAGVVALNKKAELEAACPTKVCAAEDEDIARAATRNATASTVGFVIGALGTVAGVTLLVLDATSERTKTDGVTGWELTPTGVRLRFF